MILADQLEHVPAKHDWHRTVRFGINQSAPRFSIAISTTSDRMGIYLQVYNLKPDDKTHKSSATFQFTVKKGAEQVLQFKETSEEMNQTGDQVTIEGWLPLASLAPGKYTIEINATDGISNQSISKTADFTVRGVLESDQGSCQHGSGEVVSK